MAFKSASASAVKALAFLAVLASACPLPAAEGPKKAVDPFAGAFFPPELIVLARDRIGLTPEQRKVLGDCMEKTRLRNNELRGKLERETAALAAIAKQDRVDEPALAAQLDKVLNVEREVKHLNVGLLATIKNLLTPEQRAQLRGLGKDGQAQLAEDTRKRLTEKVERVQQTAQRWVESGRDPSAIAQTMEKMVKPLLDTGKVIEAEAELDRLLERLTPDGK
jgi:Spy/CpxP family protein refolding chaperone